MGAPGPVGPTGPQGIEGPFGPYVPAFSVASIAQGGTGAQSAAGARVNLGLGSLATLNTVTTDQIPNGSITALKLVTGPAIGGSAPISMVRAWWRVQYAGGVPTLLGSNNISVILDRSVGDLGVEFTVRMPNTGFIRYGCAESAEGIDSPFPQRSGFYLGFGAVFTEIGGAGQGDTGGMNCIFVRSGTWIVVDPRQAYGFVIN